VQIDKAELVLTSSPNDDFLTAHCSRCPSVKFKLQGNALRQKELLRTLRSAFCESAQARAKPKDTYLRHVASIPFLNQMEHINSLDDSKMGQRHFVAVYTDSGCILSCDHKHQNITTAAACISQPGGYLVAVRRRKYLPLTETEEAEFQRAMFGREDLKRSGALGLLQPE